MVTAGPSRSSTSKLLPLWPRLGATVAPRPWLDGRWPLDGETMGASPPDRTIAGCLPAVVNVRSAVASSPMRQDPPCLQTLMLFSSVTLYDARFCMQAGWIGKAPTELGPTFGAVCYPDRPLNVHKWCNTHCLTLLTSTVNRVQAKWQDEPRLCLATGQCSSTTCQHELHGSGAR